MTKLRVACLLGAAAIAGAAAANAADLPTHKPAPAPAAAPAPAVVDPWKGFFVGLQGGYAWDGEQIYFPWDQNALQKSVNRSGGFIGGQAGYNYQWGPLVVGVLGEYNAADITGNATVLPVYHTTNKAEDFGSIDGKIGYAIIDRLLVYGVGGFAMGDFKHTITPFPGPDANPFPFPSFGSPSVAYPYYAYQTYSYSAFQTGYTVGGGVQYAFWNNISAFVEFRYYNFGDKNWTYIPVLGPHRTKESLSLFKGGLAYQF